MKLNVAALGLFLATGIASEESKPSNVAAKHLLPEGKGIAGTVVADVGLKANADVLFADTFEEGKMGDGWDETGNPGGKVLSFTDPAMAALGKRCVKVEAHLGTDYGGGFTKWFAPTESVFVRFYTKFDAKCDYVHHFVTLRANRGSHGGDRWSGFGGAGLLPKGDERFSTALEPWGDWSRNPPPGCWNFYSYWHEMKVSPDGKYWGNSFPVPDAPVIPRGEWICAEFMLKQNTPGQPDGEQAFWIGGKLLGHWQGINWRKSSKLQANALTVEAYITDRWTKNPVNVVYFDNVVIARKYIGPSQ